MKSIDKFVLVLVASLALLLAGCGGGSSSTEPEETGPTPEEMAMERAKTQTTALMTASTGVDTALDGLSGSEPTQAQIDAVNTAIGGLEAAIMAAADVDDAVKAGYQGKVDSAKITAMNADEALMAMEKEANEMEAKEMAALGKMLRTALGSNPLGYLAATDPATFTAGKLTISPGTLPTGVTTIPALDAGGSAGMLSGWAGMDYAHTTDDDNKVKNEARVYTNRGEPGMIPFDKEKDGRYTLVSEDGPTKGYVLLGSNEAPDTRAMADAFTHSGEQNHTKPAESDAVYISGSYDGAQGRFRCASGCSSINDGKGTVTSLEGTWHFKPDAGAMVSQPDANYLYYGWWVNKDKDGEPTAASAFSGLMASDGGLTATAIATTGSATYKGGAAGKFAMSNPLDGTGSGGHFTADAELKATFGANTEGSVTGTIDNFRLNDGSEDPGWSVALAKGELNSTNGTISAPAEDPTVWSINGNKASASGTWSGQMYDEMPAGADNDDGSNVPTTAIGEFQSMFGANGSMVGAFGVDKE